MNYIHQMQVNLIKCYEPVLSRYGLNYRETIHHVPTGACPMGLQYLRVESIYKLRVDTVM